MNREAYAEDRRQRRARNTKALIAIALWGGGCGLLYLGWSATQASTMPGKDALATVLYLITFFSVFAFWPIHRLVEHLLPDHPPSEPRQGMPLPESSKVPGPRVKPEADRSGSP